MDLKQLHELGAFVSPTLVKKEIVWHRQRDDGTTEEIKFTAGIKRLSYGLVERINRGDPENPDRSVIASLIAAAVVLGEDTEETMTYQDAYQLRTDLATALSNAIFEVNSMGGTPAKN